VSGPMLIVDVPSVGAGSASGNGEITTTNVNFAVTLKSQV